MRGAEFDAWARRQLDAVESALDRWVPNDAPAGLGAVMRYGVLAIQAGDSSGQFTDVDEAAAIVCIGMHARANTNGFLAHTYTYEPAFRVNGLDITETQIIALSAARWGVPVIMVSGDDVLETQLRPEFPDLEYAVVKTAKGRALVQFIWWAETDGQAKAPELGYAPLPKDLRPWIRARLKTVTAGGRPVLKAE